MARSNYIYIVSAEDGFEVYAAFTVKHEMTTWLKNRTTEEQFKEHPCTIMRVVDNNMFNQEPYYYSDEEILAFLED